MPRRSLWKGSFLDAFLLKMKKKGGRINNRKIYSRRSCITPEFVGSTVEIHNGINWIRCKITEGKVGHKFGEFALTRKRRGTKGGSQKKPNVGNQKKPNVGNQKRSVSTFCGHRDGSSVSTTQHNSAVLLPWMQLRTRGIQTLPCFAPWNHCLLLGNSQRYLHYGEAGLRCISGNSNLYFKDFCPDADGLVSVNTSHATMGTCRSIVCRAMRQDGAQLDVFPGTGIRSDGMGATSAACLSPLEGTEPKVTADAGGSRISVETFLVTLMMNMAQKLLQIL